ncbi:MAG: hypothetical protein A2148_08135 [Chloroflexi bacterium RBG_16_68_14]|nr:MAG: hypothetical protein A2148_08135 [Chloroflexi bacterium RBG_16_68_14]
MATNIALAIILLLTLLFTSTLFNSTVDENRERIEGLARRFAAPFRRLGAQIGVGWQAVAGAGAGSWTERAVGPVLILLLTGLVYSFNEPGLGLNNKSLLLFISLVVPIGLMSYVYEGGEALFTRHRFRVAAGVKLFPTALAIGAGFVALSRLVDFQAPIIYGFIASSAVLVPVSLERRQTGQAVFFPALLLLALSVSAWGLVIPLRELSEGSNNWWTYLPGETAAILFAGGIEGLVFAMIPVRFMDGAKVWAWNWLLWVPVFVIPAFLFSWAILNPEAKEFDALLEGRVITALCLVAAYVAVTVAMWAYFLIRSAERGAPAQP